jgi:hypothetical protein
MADLTEEKVREWLQVAAKATPGPWKELQPGDGDHGWWVWQESKLPHYGGVAECQITDGDDLEREKADAAFIALARTALPALAEDWLRLRAEYDRLVETARPLEEQVRSMALRLDKEPGNQTAVAVWLHLTNRLRAALPPEKEPSR